MSIRVQPIDAVHHRELCIDNANICMPDRIAETCVRKTPLAKDIRKVVMMISARLLLHPTVLSQAS